MHVFYCPLRRSTAHFCRCCAVTGQGAGVAAAVSVKLGQSTQELDIRAVQAELLRQKARISGPDSPTSKL